MKAVNKKRNKNLANLLKDIEDLKESKNLILFNKKIQKNTSANLDKTIRILIKEVLSEIDAKPLPGGRGGKHGTVASSGYDSEEMLSNLKREFNSLEKKNFSEKKESIKKIAEYFLTIMSSDAFEQNKKIVDYLKAIENENSFQIFNQLVNNSGDSTISGIVGKMSDFIERILGQKYVEPVKLSPDFKSQIDTLKDILDSNRFPYLKKSENEYFKKELNKLVVLSQGETEEIKKQEFIKILNKIKELQSQGTRQLQPQKTKEPYATPQNVPKTPPGVLGTIGTGIKGALGRFKGMFAEYKEIPDEVLLEMFKRANISEQMLIEITGYKRYSLKEAMEKEYD